MSDQYEPKLPDRILIRGEGEQACLLQAVEGRVALLVCGRPGGGGHGAKTVAHIDLVGGRQGRALRVDVDRALLSIDTTERKFERSRRQFALLAGLSEQERADLREHRRLVPRHSAVEVTVGRGGWQSRTNTRRFALRRGHRGARSLPGG